MNYDGKLQVDFYLIIFHPSMDSLASLIEEADIFASSRFLTKLFWTVIDFITKPLCAVIVLIYLIWSFPSSEAFEYEEENNMEDEEWFSEESCLPNFAFNQLNKYS